MIINGYGLYFGQNIEEQGGFTPIYMMVITCQCGGNITQLT